MNFLTRHSTIILVLCFQVICSLLLWRVLRHDAPSLERVDLNAVIQQYVSVQSKVSAQSKLTPQAQQQQVAEFTQNLTRVLERYAAQRHVTLLVSPAVVAGATDATDAILNELHLPLRGSP